MMNVDFLPVIITLTIIWFLFRIFECKKNGLNIIREIILNIFFIYLMTLLYVVFFPMSIIFYAWEFSYNLVPFEETIAMIKGANFNTSFINIVGNMILLFPLGIFIPFLNKNSARLYKMVCTGFLVSLSIELIQLVLMIRIFDIDDLIFNTISIILGYCIYLIIVRIKLYKKLQSKIQKKGKSNLLIQLLVSIFVIMIVITCFWTIEYFKTTKSLNKGSKNNIYDTISNDIVCVNDDYGYYSVITKDSDYDKKIKVYGFRKTPFNRAVSFVTTDFLEPNAYGNSINYIGNSTIDNKMLYIIYGYNSMSNISISLKSGKNKLNETISEGYFIISFKADIKGSNIQFNLLNNSGEDITQKFQTAE